LPTVSNRLIGKILPGEKNDTNLLSKNIYRFGTGEKNGQTEWRLKLNSTIIALYHVKSNSKISSINITYRDIEQGCLQYA